MQTVSLFLHFPKVTHAETVKLTPGGGGGESSILCRVSRINKYITLFAQPQNSRNIKGNLGQPKCVFLIASYQVQEIEGTNKQFRLEKPFSVFVK